MAVPGFMDFNDTASMRRIARATDLQKLKEITKEDGWPSFIRRAAERRIIELSATKREPMIDPDDERLAKVIFGE